MTPPPTAPAAVPVLSRPVSTRPAAGRSAGFTLIEVAALAAALVIVLGLMVSLARYVRARSAGALTRSLLAAVDRSLDQYAARFGEPPDVASPLAGLDAVPADAPAEPANPAGPAGLSAPSALAADGAAEGRVRAAALENNRRFVQAMRGVFIRAARPATTTSTAATTSATTPSTTPATTADAATRPAAPAVPFAGLPTALYDERTLRDAWGSPVAFMPARDPRVGTAPGDRPFAFSAGPDRRYLTRGDNVYSYESAPAPTLAAP